MITNDNALVIEDSPLTREFHMARLRSEGFSPYSPATTPELQDLLDVEASTYRVALIDRKLWGGMDGVEIAKRLVKRVERIFIVTAYSEDIDRRELEVLGITVVRKGEDNDLGLLSIEDCEHAGIPPRQLLSRFIVLRKITAILSQAGICVVSALFACLWLGNTLTYGALMALGAAGTIAVSTFIVIETSGPAYPIRLRLAFYFAALVLLIEMLYVIPTRVAGILR